MSKRSVTPISFVAQVATLLVVASGCAVFSPPPATEEERRAYSEAVAPASGDSGESEQQIEAFLRAFPESPLADDAGVKLGELARARGDLESAASRYQQVIDRHPDGDRADLARVRLAEVELSRGNRASAEAVLAQVRFSRLSRAERADAYRLLAEVAPDPVAKLRRLARVREHAADEDAAALVDVEIDSVLVVLTPDELRSAADQLDTEIPAARIALRIGELAMVSGDVATAEQQLEIAEDLPIAPNYVARLEALALRLEGAQAGHLSSSALPTFADLENRPPPDITGASGTIGVVLPLSGPFARFGEESLQGVLLAARIFAPPAEDGSGVRLLIRDSKGTPEGAAIAVRDLADNDDVSAIIGPLVANASESAAVVAEEAGVPLIALTSREDVAAGREQVMRVRTMPKEEVEILVEYAMRELGATTFAILYPADAYGRGLRDLFWEAVELRGGGIVGVARYEPEATDFAQPIRHLIGWTLLDNEERRVIGEREDMMHRARRMPPEEALALREEARALTTEDGTPLPPIVDFDALFIPESHDKVVLIAPQLAFHEVNETRLLGSSGWYHPDLTRIARKHVEGALFTAHFYPDSTVPFVRHFREDYEATFAAVPEAFAAQAYDAARIVLVQLARGATDRDDMRSGVLAVRDYPGVTGVLSIRPDGNATKRPFLLGVERGRVLQVDQSPGGAPEGAAAIP
jgi:ABC-type branched-subunit amino acid transport system substrate-binding protein